MLHTRGSNYVSRYSEQELMKNIKNPTLIHRTAFHPPEQSPVQEHQTDTKKKNKSGYKYILKQTNPQ